MKPKENNHDNDIQSSIDSLLNEAEELRLNDPLRSFELCNDALRLAKAHTYEYGTARSHYLLGIYYSNRSDYTRALSHLKKSSALYKKLGNDVLMALAFHRQAVIWFRQGDSAKALATIESNLEIFEKYDDYKGLAFSFNYKGVIYHNSGDYGSAMDHYLRALEIWEKHSMKAEAGTCYDNLAILCKALGNTDLALRYYGDSLRLARETGNRFGEAMALKHTGSVYMTQNMDEEALACLEEARTIFSELEAREKEADSLITIGVLYDKKQELTRARRYQAEALRIVKSTGGRELEAYIYGNIGTLDRKEGKLASAVTHINKAISIARIMDDRALIFQLYKELSEIHEELRNTDEALQHYKTYVELRDEIIGYTKQREILLIQDRLDKKEGYRELDSKIEHKTKQLAVSALTLVQKNKLLEKMQKQVALLLRMSTTGKHGSLPPLLRQLQHEIQQNIQSGQGWQDFEQQMEQIQYRFISALSERYPSLSSAELKICALLKINLSTKEIADLLHISPRTVNLHRHNIRKKLRLGPGANLTTHLHISTSH